MSPANLVPRSTRQPSAEVYGAEVEARVTRPFADLRIGPWLEGPMRRSFAICAASAPSPRGCKGGATPAGNAAETQSTGRAPGALETLPEAQRNAVHALVRMRSRSLSNAPSARRHQGCRVRAYCGGKTATPSHSRGGSAQVRNDSEAG